jgi:cytochrome c peroxidase
MGRWLLVVALCGALCRSGTIPSDAVDRVPADQLALYVPPTSIPYPGDNPSSPAKARLGQELFFDPILSGARDMSCSTCHQPALSWGDGRARAIGANHEPMALRSPTLIDVAWMERLGWDGKFRDLESVAFSPITAHDNMDLAEDEALARLRAVPAYVQLYREAFGTADIDRHGIEQALATYQRSIVSGEAPFDRWVAGDASAITPAAKRGFALFNGRAGCASCHSGWPFSDGSFHDIGTATGDDIGRGRLFPTSVKLRYAFKTPTLRDVARRAPYMHDGSLPNLRAVIDLYDRGGVARPSRADEIHPLGLSERDKEDLLAFLDTLTAGPKPSD